MTLDDAHSQACKVIFDGLTEVIHTVRWKTSLLYDGLIESNDKVIERVHIPIFNDDGLESDPTCL